MRDFPSSSSLHMQDKRKTNGQTHLGLLAEKSLERRYCSELRVGRRVVELRLLPGLPLEDGREPGAVLLVKGLHEYHRLALEAQLQARALAPDESLRLLAKYGHEEAEVGQFLRRDLLRLAVGRLRPLREQLCRPLVHLLAYVDQHLPIR